MLVGEGTQGEVFEPHSRVGDLRLVPGQEDWGGWVDRPGVDVPILRGPSPGFGHQLPPRLLGHVQKRPPLEVVAILPAAGPISPDQSRHFVKRGIHEGPTVFSRRAEPAILQMR